MIIYCLCKNITSFIVILPNFFLQWPCLIGLAKFLKFNNQHSREAQADRPTGRPVSAGLSTPRPLSQPQLFAPRSPPSNEGPFLPLHSLMRVKMVRQEAESRVILLCYNYERALESESHSPYTAVFEHEKVNWNCPRSYSWERRISKKPSLPCFHSQHFGHRMCGLLSHASQFSDSPDTSWLSYNSVQL